VDLNRSLSNPALFSEFSKLLSPEDRLAVLSSRYHPHRQAVTDAITRKIHRGCPVLHLAVHTFTSELRGKVRKTDIGLLYDPARKEERTLCAAWKRALTGRDSALCVRRNYPYLGSSDGLATDLRKTLSGRWYLGIELEVNNRHWFRGRKVWTQLGVALAESLDQLLAG
jgi:predicted N-formylglutamate amidohydrolase